MLGKETTRTSGAVSRIIPKPKRSFYNGKNLRSRKSQGYYNAKVKAPLKKGKIDNQRCAKKGNISRLSKRCSERENTKIMKSVPSKENTKIIKGVVRKGTYQDNQICS